MREILFRGKRTNNGEWVEGSLFAGDNGECEICFGTPRVRITYDVAPETVGQFTGLYDKNGTKIFEGDVIRYADIYDYNCYLESLENEEAYEGCEYSNIFAVDEVVFCNAIGYPAFDLNKHSFEVNGLSELQESGAYHYEVIGNVWDNPKLLEGETE